MDEYEWRSWLRSVTPFIDGKYVRRDFAKHEAGAVLARPETSVRMDDWIYLITTDGHLFSLHCRDRRDQTKSFYAVHTAIDKNAQGRAVQIKYWPELGEILWRMGIDFANDLVREAVDGHQHGLLSDQDLNIPAFRVLEDGDMLRSGDLFLLIQHEINSAWFHEPADLEREALLAESKKASPAPKASGRAGRL